MRNKIIFILLGLFLVVVTISFFKIGDCVATENHTVKLCTNYGDIVFETYRNDAPNTVNNFLKLVSQDFYDGLTFHRVVEGFMIQGGDPFCTNGQGLCGTGGPGYQFADELDPDTFSANQGYVRGVVAMANSGPDTNGSQFFILHQDKLLAHQYTIFGKVVSGQDVVDKIASVPVDDNNQPIKPVIINDVGYNR